MDETMKTRSLFEISKGSFRDEKNSVNRRVEPEKRWAPFQNIIYIGDGDTDVPSLSLVRSQGGLGIAVYNPETSMQKVNEKLKHMRLEKRTDLITPAKFEASSELFDFLQARCIQIALRYRAEQAI
jgi:predicted HAD superfamily phosphohydrolase